jgi:hypothetical protein
VHAAERIGDGSFCRDHRHHVRLHAPLHVVEREHIRGVGHGHEDFPVHPRDRHDLVRLRHLARDQTHDLFGNPESGEIYRRDIETTPHAEGHVLISDELLVRQNFQEPTAFLLLDRNRFLELIRQQQTVLDEHIGNAFAKSFVSHGAKSLGSNR